MSDVKYPTFDEFSYWGTEEEWAFVDNMQPSGEDLDRLVDQFPAPREWYFEFDV